MMMASTNPASTYTNIGIETGVQSASPHKLILMLYDGALLAIGMAQHGIESNNIGQKGERISKAIDIIANGLKASLNIQAGGELAERLDALYDYMCHRLLHANLRNDIAALNEVRQLLNELKGAWEEIADDPAVVSDSRKVA